MSNAIPPPPYQQFYGPVPPPAPKPQMSAWTIAGWTTAAGAILLLIISLIGYAASGRSAAAADSSSVDVDALVKIAWDRLDSSAQDNICSLWTTNRGAGMTIVREKFEPSQQQAAMDLFDREC